MESTLHKRVAYATAFMHILLLICIGVMNSNCSSETMHKCTDLIPN